MADEDDDEIRPFTREELGAVLAIAPPRHEIMFRLIAATGLRIGETLALQFRHLQLDGSNPVVRVRRAVSKGQRLEPPKSRYGRRDIPLDHALVLDLRDHRRASEESGPESLVFPTRSGTVQSYSNLRRRVLKPVVEEAAVPWAGFHTFRHTFASLHIARGTNAVQLSRLLGHHSAAFTLSTYVHLIDGDIGSPLALDDELSDGPLYFRSAAGMMATVA